VLLTSWFSGPRNIECVSGGEREGCVVLLRMPVCVKRGSRVFISIAPITRSFGAVSPFMIDFISIFTSVPRRVPRLEYQHHGFIGSSSWRTGLTITQDTSGQWQSDDQFNPADSRLEQIRTLTSSFIPTNNVHSTLHYLGFIYWTVHRVNQQTHLPRKESPAIQIQNKPTRTASGSH
jgi:hypothetical protein